MIPFSPRQAYDSCTEYDFEYGTEVRRCGCPHARHRQVLHLALQYTGTRAKMVPATANVFKVTFKQDLYAAEMAPRCPSVRV